MNEDKINTRENKGNNMWVTIMTVFYITWDLYNEMGEYIYIKEQNKT